MRTTNHLCVWPLTYHRVVCSVHCCSPCTSRQSATSSQHTVWTTINTLTTRRCTWPFDPALIDVTFTAVSECVEDVARGSLRTDCFSAQPRRRQFCSGLRPSEIRYRLRAASTSQGRWSLPFRDVKLLGVTLDSVLIMDRHVTEVIRSCSYHTRTAPHPTAADTRRRQDDRPQHCVISAGLRQRTAARHVGLQHQQAAGGVKFVGQDSLSSLSVSQRHRVASSASLAASSTTDFLQVAVITYKTCSTSKPGYLSDLLQDY